ncbi:hypothetical protein L1049_002049 [Liquidambar formosana]|uniref:Neprosin PEP catalytic domain-containing protein n=1 Tax=Liquidambar formosana TaxID=63359 RepID=A0AAP0NGE8_LIQFO
MNSVMLTSMGKERMSVFCIMDCELSDADVGGSWQQDLKIHTLSPIEKYPSPMEPIFSPKWRSTIALQENVQVSSKNEPSFVSNSLKIGLKEGCPQGTVPMGRTTEERLIRAKSIFRGLHLNDFSNKVTGNGLETETNTIHRTCGAEAHIDIYQPIVDHGKISAAAVMVQSGGPGMLGTARAGWMVIPDLYGDGRTRMFTSWSDTNNGRVLGCFNTDCLGFIIVNPSIPLNMPFDNVSVIGGIQYDMKFFILQDDAQNWWLMVHDNNE